jgi:hypothetical protein
VTAAIAGVSIALDPSAWRAWIDILANSSSVPADTPGWVLPVPLLVRLPIAVVVVLVAARTDRVWLLPVGVLLALPVVWLNGFAILAACWPLRSRAAIEARPSLHLTLRSARSDRAPGSESPQPVTVGVP